MARRYMVVCDACKTEEEEPELWGHFTMEHNLDESGCIYEVLSADLCPSCFEMVVSTLGDTNLVLRKDKHNVSLA